METEACDEDLKVQSRTSSPTGDRSVQATRDALTCVDREGSDIWRFDFGPRPGSGVVSHADCEYSLDGTAVWLYRPDVCSGRGDTDRWFALDAATGAVLGDAAIPTSGGHGGTHHVHPDGRDVLLDVGCGQDGSYLFSGRIDQGRMEWSAWPSADAPGWGYQYMTGLSADGRLVLAFDHDGEEVVVYEFATGTALVRIPYAAFGYDLEEDRIETARMFTGRFVDDRTAVVEFQGETSENEEEEGEPEWAAAGLDECTDFIAYHAIDLREGCVIGPCDADGSHAGERSRFRRPEDRPRQGA
jgi:hypothetical protein